MNRFCIIFAALAGLSLAQSPIIDTIVVTFSTEVQVASKVLSAGEYTIRQLSSASNSRLLEFTSDKGTTIQASATAIPTIDNNNRNDSSVILENRGNRQHVHKIWIKGKTYGYEFPIDEPATSTNSSAVRETRLNATYEPRTAETPAQVAQAAPASAAPKVVTEPAQATAPVAAPEPAQVAAAEPAPAPQQSAPAPAQPTATIDNATNNQPASPAMPNTSIDWASYVMTGNVLFCCGLLMLALRKQS